MKKYDYGHLEEIEVRREDQKLYKFKEDERYDLNVALHMFTRRIVIQRRMENLQLGVKSYQKKLNLNKPDTFRNNKGISAKEEMEWIRQMKGSGYDPGYRKAALSKKPLGMMYKSNKSENNGIVPTDMELVLEQTQEGTSHEVSISTEGVEELKRKVKIKGEKKKALLTLRQKPGQYICCQNHKDD
nr:hypothetical protein [Tanacetum cinerariifolium]